MEVHSERHGDTRIRIFYDETPSSPREDTTLATIIGWDRGYLLSDKGQPQPRYMGEDYTPLEWWRSYVGAEGEDSVPSVTGVLFAAPLELQDYGSNGVRLDIGIDSWDRSSGVVFVTQDDWNTCMGADHPSPQDYDGWVDLIKGEIAAYQDYINGNVYGYVVETLRKCDLGAEHAVEEDSCWGFIGDWEYALSEARSSAGVDVQRGAE